ncbi:Uncharacterised protein [Mycobacteroides abscessus subsp. abscessus]|nr:Uncharacterised protein [Mycobacteroides abscessus subsp. abscessus]
MHPGRVQVVAFGGNHRVRVAEPGGLGDALAHGSGAADIARQPNLADENHIGG